MSPINIENREYLEVYDQLYKHSKITVENSLRPLKEFYYHNPQLFDPNDASLMEKALNFSDR